MMELVFGAAVTGGVLYLSTFVAPRPAVWLLYLLAVAVALFGFVIGRRPKWRRKMRGRSSGGWIASGGGGSSSSSSSDSSSSGDFGGGSSGGGGASGRW